MVKFSTLLKHRKKLVDFNALCKEYEALEPAVRNTLILEKTDIIFKDFCMFSDNKMIKPSNALIAIMMDVSIIDNDHDAKIDALFMPYLMKIFGDDSEIKVLKMVYPDTKEGRAALHSYVADILKIIHERSPSLEIEVLGLCLLITSAKGILSANEKKHLKEVFSYLKL